MQIAITCSLVKAALNNQDIH